MDEKDINRELDEMLVMLKTFENKFLSNTSEKYVSISDICNIYAIHLAVLVAYDAPEEALEFIIRMYTGATMQNKKDNIDPPLVLLNSLSGR